MPATGTSSFACPATIPANGPDWWIPNRESRIRTGRTVSPPTMCTCRRDRCCCWKRTEAAMNSADYTWGAHPVGAGLWRFRLWAPGIDVLELRLDGRDYPMQPLSGGWFGVELAAEPGAEYAFVLPDGMVVPD